MPMYIDRHENLQLPQEALDQIAADMKSGTRYDDGVKPINAYVNPQGAFFCITDAADAEAVRKHHEAAGIPCGEVIEIRPLV